MAGIRVLSTLSPRSSSPLASFPLLCSAPSPFLPPLFPSVGLSASTAPLSVLLYYIASFIFSVCPGSHRGSSYTGDDPREQCVTCNWRSPGLKSNRRTGAKCRQKDQCISDPVAFASFPDGVHAKSTLESKSREADASFFIQFDARAFLMQEWQIFY